MSVKLTPIKDPGLKDKDGKGNTTVKVSPNIDKHMKMRDLKLEELKGTDWKAITLAEAPKPDPKLSALPKIGEKDNRFEVEKVCPKVIEAIEPVDNKKHFCVGKGSTRTYCGPVFYRVPSGAYARIGSGKCRCLSGPPITKDGQFHFEKDRQLAVKVGNKIGTDFLVVVTANGCVLIDAGGSAAFNMPVFVVELTGMYYKMDKGKRVFHLMSGGHLCLYTYEAPILFPRVDYNTKLAIKAPLSQKSGDKTKSTEKKSSEAPKTPLKKEELKKVESKKEEPKKEEPKKEAPKPTPKPKEEEEESTKDEPKKEEPKPTPTPLPKPTPKPKEEEEESTKDEPKKEEPKKPDPKPVVLPPPPKPVAAPIVPEAVPAPAAAEGQGLSKQKIIAIIAAIAVGLICFYLFFIAGRGSDDEEKPPKRKKNG